MTGLEPATSGVTGRCSNQLSYIPSRFKGRREKITSAIGRVKGPVADARLGQPGLLGLATRTDGDGWRIRPGIDGEAEGL
jgi:hypothetical protein